jgi:hypothetical protein
MVLYKGFEVVDHPTDLKALFVAIDGIVDPGAGHLGKIAGTRGSRELPRSGGFAAELYRWPSKSGHEDTVLEVTDAGRVLLSQFDSGLHTKTFAAYSKGDGQAWSGKSTESANFAMTEGKTLEESLKLFGLDTILKSLLVDNAAKLGYLLI